MVVTVGRAATVQEHNEGHNVSTEFLEIQRALCSLYFSRIFFDIATGYYKIFRPQDRLLLMQLSPRSVFMARLVAIHDGRHLPQPPFPTVAPPIQTFHLITYLLNLTTILFNQ